MTATPKRHHRAPERAREALAQSLGERHTEIEQEVLTRILAVSGPGEQIDAEYREGLKAAVAAAVRYGLEAVEIGEERSPSPPPILRAQARMGARAGVGLDTVLRRYFAGHALFGDYLVAEAARAGIGGAELQPLLRAQATLFDRLLAVVSEEYGREAAQRPSSTERRRVEKVERLLAGEMVDVSGLRYDFDGHHLGLLAQGEGAQEAIRELAGSLDRSLLLVTAGEETAWAWLGGRRPLDSDELAPRASAHCSEQLRLAAGEPGEGLGAWRLTHRQARAALPVALRGSEPFVRYAEVALLTAVLRDELLATSLRKLYLEPLEAERDGGELARETLRAYFGAGRNVSSAAAMLGVSRQAVAKRLLGVERRLDRSLSDCDMELDAALSLGRLDDHADQPHSPQAVK